MKEEQASSTAFTVLQGMLLSAARPALDGLVSAEAEAACRRILGASDEGRKRLAQVQSPLFRTLAPIIERLLMPGISLHYPLRKRFIEESVRQALAAGYTQVINLGAGFDSLAWRLHSRFPAVTFIEIDHPATSKVKVQALDESGDNLHLLAVDLAEHDLESVLSQYPAFDSRRRTVFVCEGVLMYLPEAAVVGMFAALKRLNGAGTRFVFSAIPPQGSANDNTGVLLRLYLKFKSEPLAWHMERAQLTSFVGRQGYRVRDTADDSELFPRYLPGRHPGVLHRGEYLVDSEAL